MRTFGAADIAGMPDEYEADHRTGMDVLAVARSIEDYTSGYPFLVSRIFESLLYNYFLSMDESCENPLWLSSARMKNQFIENGRLNMDRVPERFVVSFDDICGDSCEELNEEEGRRRFLLCFSRKDSSSFWCSVFSRAALAYSRSSRKHPVP